ncbi:MAG: hypothetical protein JJ958_06690 [Balneola sp.]|nr:hypothetical protein [Balneola sp.]
MKYILTLALLFINTSIIAQNIKVDKDDWKGNITVTDENTFRITKGNYEVNYFYISSSTDKGKNYSHSIGFLFSENSRTLNKPVDGIYLKAGDQEPVEGTVVKDGGTALLKLSGFEVQEIKRSENLTIRIYITPSYSIDKVFSQNEVDYILNFINKAELEKI